MTQTSIFRPGIFGSNRLTSLCGFEKSRIPVLCTVLWKLTTTCETGPHLFCWHKCMYCHVLFYSYAYDGSYAVCAQTYFCFLNRCTFLWSLYKPSMARRYRGYNRTTATALFCGIVVELTPAPTTVRQYNMQTYTFVTNTLILFSLFLNSWTQGFVWRALVGIFFSFFSLFPKGGSANG